MTGPTRRQLAREAMLRSIDVRTWAGLDLNSPLDVYDLCNKRGVEVQFVDISMEGLYIRRERPRILLSALRPFPRRVFTCGHELGHHEFGHGSTVDELTDEAAAPPVFKPDEFLVQTFAGFLLMPTLGVRKALAVRGLRAERATPAQLYTVACSFGVGYATLVTHLTYGLDMTPRHRAAELLKVPLPRIRHEILGTDSAAPLTVVDRYWALPTLDTEVDTQILLPHGAEIEGDRFVRQASIPAGQLYVAAQPGIATLHLSDIDRSLFVRASRYQYVGLSRYRHLEDADDEEREITHDT